MPTVLWLWTSIGMGSGIGVGKGIGISLGLPYAPSVHWSEAPKSSPLGILIVASTGIGIGIATGTTLASVAFAAPTRHLWTGFGLP